jgi:hypothetical protein
MRPVLDEPLIQLDHAPGGHHAVCDGTDCGSRRPGYRVCLGAYERFFCEACLARALLEATPRRVL